MSIASAPPAPGDWDYRPSAPVPFDRFRQELLELYRPPLRARATLTRMRQTLAIVAELVGPDGTTAGLTPTLVARIIETRPDGERPRTTHTTLAYLRAACSFAKSQGYIRTSPFEYRKSWLRVGPAREGKHHPIADLRRVLDLLAAEVAGREGWARWRARRLQALAALVAYTGLRRDEALSLHADDVDIPGRMVLLVERAGRFKTEMSAQPVPMPEDLAPILEGWMARRLDAVEGLEGGPRPAPECPWLFPGVSRKGAWKGGPTGHKPLDQLKAAGIRAGVPGLTFQSLRHSFATHGESAWGLSPATIQRVLRHSTQATQRHYRHADAANLRAAVGRVGFGPAAGPDAAGDPTP